MTARRLYLDAMEEVLKSAGKIFIDPSGGGSASPIVPYLPLPAPPSAFPQTGAQPAPKANP